VSKFAWIFAAPFGAAIFAAAAAEPVVAPTEAAATSRTLWVRLAVAIAIIAAVFIYWLTRPA